MTTDQAQVQCNICGTKFPLGGGHECGGWAEKRTRHLLAAIHDGQAEQTALLRALVERLPTKGDPCPCGCRRDVDPTPEVSEYRSCLPSLGERRCGACRGLSDRHVVGCDGTWGR